jgi:hypothetical protein
MADKKISALTAATTPLAGTEVLPIVQSGTTVKVAVSDLTAGRAVATAGGSFTNNITQSTAAKGVNFTANTPAAGMTSQLFNWYEQGGPLGIGRVNFTEVLGAGSISSLGYYTRVGNLVQLHIDIVCTGGATIAAVSNVSYLTGIPFTPIRDSAGIWLNVNLGTIGGIRANAGNIMVISTAWAASSNSWSLDCTYSV